MIADFFKFMFGFIIISILIIAAILAAPTMWEQATTDKAKHPHSGATPECPTWDVSLEEGMERAELIRQFRTHK